VRTAPKVEELPWTWAYPVQPGDSKSSEADVAGWAGVTGWVFVWAALKPGIRSVISTMVQVDLNSVLLSPVQQVNWLASHGPTGLSEVNWAVGVTPTLSDSLSTGRAEKTHP
jgi:hypothetical protein